MPTGVLVAPVRAARGAGLADHDLGEAREHRSEPLPDPAGEDLAGRVLEPSISLR